MSEEFIESFFKFVDDNTSQYIQQLGEAVA